MTSVDYHIIKMGPEISFFPGEQQQLEDLDCFFATQNRSETEVSEFVQIDRTSVQDDQEWSEGSEGLRNKLLSYMDAEGMDHAVVMRTHYY